MPLVFQMVQELQDQRRRKVFQIDIGRIFLYFALQKLVGTAKEIAGKFATVRRLTRRPATPTSRETPVRG